MRFVRFVRFVVICHLIRGDLRDLDKSEEERGLSRQTAKCTLSATCALQHATS